MEYNLILKNINNAIDKCSKPKYFSRNTKKKLNTFAKETINLPYEQVIILDPEGNIIYEKRDGDKDNVRIDDYNIADYVVQPDKWVGGNDGHLVKQSNKYNELDIEHNHPTVNGFEGFPAILSKNDTAKLASMMNSGFPFRSITAESNNTRMSLIRKYDKRLIDGSEIDYEYQKELQSKILECNNHFDKVVTDYVKMYRDKILEYTNLPAKDMKKYFGDSAEYGDSEIRMNINKKALSDIGSLSDFLDSRGIIKEYDDAGVILLLEG